MMRIIEDIADDWRRLDERIEGLSGEIEAIARQNVGCERLMSVPGIGPIISSAMVAAIGARDMFSKGRDFAAWLGLVPRQISTGDRTILGKISKRSNRYLRASFVQAAWVVLIRPKSWERHGLKKAPYGLRLTLPNGWPPRKCSLKPCTFSEIAANPLVNLLRRLVELRPRGSAATRRS